jgi:hypothetical protein
LFDDMVFVWVVYVNCIFSLVEGGRNGEVVDGKWMVC